MGVPGFFKWLIDQYNKNTLIIEKIDVQIDSLYIDANCLFHPQCFKILALHNTEKNTEHLEKLMIERIIKYIEYIVNFTKPKTTYIAVDGPAPLAKINQQRKRRFKTVIYDEIKNNLKKKYRVDNSGCGWTNTVITPGTEFMEKLHKELLKFTTKNNILYSSYHEQGEGEHKILQYIKKHGVTNTNSVIYGLDADLFFLAMASGKDNIYLLREASQISDKKTDPTILEEELNYISIDIVKACYNRQIKDVIIRKTNSTSTDINNNFCNDFIVICCLLGNDFLPHFPSLCIKKNGLDILVDIYTDLYIELQTNLIDDATINNKFLGLLLEKIGSKEVDFLENVLPNYVYKQQRKRCFATTNYEKELWRIDNLRFDFRDEIRLGLDNEQDWKKRYYSYYKMDNLNNVCKNYLEGLKWVILYYFKECPTWRWQCEYHNAPFVSDLSEFFKKYKCNMNKIVFNNESPLSPCQQLFCVVPKQNKNILPKAYAKFHEMNNALDIFPEQIEIDLQNKDQFWQCEPMLPLININYIVQLTKNIKLTVKEKERDLVL